MKKVILINISLFLLGIANAQTSWKGTTSTNWNTASNWTSGVPSSAKDVIIGDANFTGAFQPLLTSTSACKSLTIGNDAKVSTLTVARNIAVSGDILIGSNGTIVHNVANTTITFKGNWTNSGTYAASVSTTQVTFSGTAQLLTGTTTFQRVGINAGSIVTLANNISINTSLSVSGTLDPTASFTVSGTGTFTVNAGGVILVKAADFASNYSLSGAVTLSGTSTVKYASSTIDQNITNALTYGYLRISGGMTKYLVGNLPALNSATGISGRIYIDAGTLDLQMFTANRSAGGGGSVIIAAGAKLKIGGTNTFPSNYNTITLSATSTVEYSGTNQTVLGVTYGNLILSSSSGVAIKTLPGSSMTIAGSLTGSTGSGTGVTFTAGANITVNRDVTLDAATTFNGSSFAHRFKGNWANAGTYTGTSSSVTFSGVNGILSGTGTNNFYNLIFSGTGITAQASTSINVAGNLSTSGAGTFTHSAGGTITMSGAAKTISGNGFKLSNCIITGTVSTAANITISGDFTIDASFTATARTITLNGTSKTIAGSGTITFFALSVLGTISTANSFTLSSNLSVSVAGSLTATAGTATIGGNSVLSGRANLFNVTINSGKTLRLGSSSILGIANTFTKNGTLNVTTNIPNTVEYNSSGAQTIVNTTYNNLILANGGSKAPTAAIIVNNDFTINAGVTFAASSYTHSIYRHFINNGTFTANTSTIQLLGTNSASISGNTTFNTLVINKSSLLILITLVNNITATTLTMTSGTMNTAANSVTITGTRTGAGIIIGTITHSHAFVNGTAYSFEGPQNLITFTAPSASLTSVTVVVTIGPISDFNVGSECVLREYNISIPAGTYTNTTLRLHYEDNELNAFYEPSLAQYHFNTGTSSWDSIGVATRSTVTNYVEQTGITTPTGRWTFSGTRNVVRWNGSVSSAWENSANWTTLSGASMANRVPTSDDDAQIGQETFTYHPIINSAQTVNILRYGSVQASTVTINSGSLTSLGGIKAVWTSPASHVLDVASGSFSVGTNMDLSDGTSGHDIELKIGNGSATISNNLNQSATGSVNFTGSGTLTINGHYNYTGGSFTAGTGTVEYTGSLVQVVAPVRYNNLSFTKSAERASFNLPTIIDGNLTTSVGGELAVSDTLTVAGNISIGANTNFIETGARINLGGNWSNSGTFTVDDGSVNFNGNGNQTVDANTFNTILINKSAGTLSLTGDLVLNSDLTLSAGTLDLSTYLANRSNPGGTLTLGASSLLKVGGAANFPDNYITKTINTTNTVEYLGTVAQSVADADYGNLTFTNGGSNTKSLLGDIQINGDLLINTDAMLDPDSNKITLYGNFTNSGTFPPNGSTLILNGSSKTFAGNTTLYNLTAITGSYTFTSSTLSITGDLFVDTGASLNFGNATITSDGDLTNKGSLTSNGTTTFTGTRLQTFQLINAVSSTSTGIINFNGTVAPITNSTGSSVSFATVNINNTGAGGVTLSAPWTVAIAMNIGVGATVNFGSLTHTFLGNFTNNGTVVSSGDMKFTPIPPYSSGATITLDTPGGGFTSTGNVYFGGTSSITLIDNNPVFNNIYITNVNAAGVTPPSGWTIGQDLYTGIGAEFKGGSGLSHTIAGDVINNGTLTGGTSTITFTGNPVTIDGLGTGIYNNLTIATGADLTLNKSITLTGNLVSNGNFTTTGRSVTFSGNTASTISGTASSVTFEDFEQSKSTTTTLSIPVVITGDLVLTSGIINTSSTNILTLNDNATSTTGNATSFIDGPMKKTGNDPFIFPVGDGSVWAPIEIVNDADFQNFDATTIFTCQYFTTAPPHSNEPAYMNTGLDHVSSIEYWDLDRTSDPGSNAQCNVALYWNDATRSKISDNSDLALVHFAASTSNKWEDQGGTGVGTTTGTIVSTYPLTTFSPITFGSRIGNNQLPIQLLNFSASLNTTKQVDIKWSTATETNNAYFTIERSSDGITFSQVLTVTGAGNSNNKINYSASDKSPLDGYSYYRLKQTDFDGKFSYSKTAIINLEDEPISFEVNVFPQPIKSGTRSFMKITSAGNKRVLIVVYDITGKEYFSKAYIPEQNKNCIVALDSMDKLAPGIYFILASSENNLYKQKIVVE